MMLIKSQTNLEPNTLKSTTVKKVEGVKVGVFRVSEPNMNRLFGTPYLPLLNPKEELAQKLMQQAHTTRKHDYHPVHRTLESARTALSSGSYRVWVRGATGYLQTLTFTCVTCNSWRNWTYSPPLGDKYVRLNNQIGPFREISMDPLGHIVIKPYPGARKTVKAFPLMIKCLHSAATGIILMESMETKQIIYSLLKLEAKYGELKGISRDAGTNMLTENLNPKTEDDQRLFNLVGDYAAPTDAQFRNYSERSTGLIKKYLRQAAGVEKTENLPVMIRSEMELLCALACGMVNRIPYGRSKELIMICPADTLMFGQKLEHIPETKSKLHGINNMIHNINLHREEMIKIRNDHLAQELSTAKHQTKKEGRIARTIEPQIALWASKQYYYTKMTFQIKIA